MKKRPNLRLITSPCETYAGDAPVVGPALESIARALLGPRAAEAFLPAAEYLFKASVIFALRGAIKLVVLRRALGRV